MNSSIFNRYNRQTNLSSGSFYDLSCNYFTCLNSLESKNIIVDNQISLGNNLLVNNTNISPTNLSYLYGSNSNIQNQINNINTQNGIIDSSLNVINNSISNLNTHNAIIDASLNEINNIFLI